MTRPKHLEDAELLDPIHMKKAKEIFESLFGLLPPDVTVYIHKKKLYLQLGSTWIPKDITQKEPPVIQLHPKLLKEKKASQSRKGLNPIQRLKSLFQPHYTLEEVLTHEWVHCLRAGIFPKCNQLAFEEILAYQTSPRPFRKYLGPLLSRPSDTWILACSLLLFWIDALELSFFDQGILAIIGLGGFVYLSIKLLVCHCLFKRAQGKLKAIPCPLGELIKMSDKEIAKATSTRLKDLSLS